MQRLAEDAVEEGARRANLVRDAHLAEDLALAGNERVQPRRNAEEMESRGAIVETVERGLDLRLERGQRGNSVAFRRVGVLRSDVDLGAVAGREADRFAPALREPRRERLRIVPLERDAFAQLDRSVMVRRANENEADHVK